MDRLEVLKPGTQVVLGYPTEDEPIIGAIIEVIIGTNASILYRCQWWNARNLEDKWLPAYFVKKEKLVEPKDKLSIGFHNLG